MTPTKNKPRVGEPLPYYRWYWRDWRGSRGVQKMTATERGIYRELLDEQWRTGHLVNDPEWLAEAAMCTEQELANAWQVLSKCFPPIDGTDGQLLANTRLEAERTEQDVTRAKRARAGSLGGKANAKQMLHSSSRAEQSSSNGASGVAAQRLEGASAPPCECGENHAEDCPHRPADPQQLADVLAGLRIYAPIIHREGCADADR